MPLIVLAAGLLAPVAPPSRAVIAAPTPDSTRGAAGSRGFDALAGRPWRGVVVPFAGSTAAVMATLPAAARPPARDTGIASADPIAAAWMPGREEDARVAAIAFRLATAGLSRCPAPRPTTGMVLQHLTQFELADRAALAASQALDRGPEVIVVVAGGPAAAAGIVPGDVLLAVDGVPLPPQTDLAAPFDAARARARADRIDDLVAGTSGDTPRTLTLLRHGATVAARLAPRPACPSTIHLARSAQLNAFADGRHVFVTTGLLARLSGDDQLAFVLAHEMAHNILGHAALMRRDTVKGIGHTLGHSGEVVRQAERDADRLGGELMLAAGYDPVAGVEALRRLGGVDLGIALFAAHDPVDERIAAMRRLVADRAAPSPAR